MNPPRTLTAAALKSWIDTGREHVLIDVSLHDDFACAHLPGAWNAPVYEMTFLDHIGRLEPLKRSLMQRAIGLEKVDHAEPLVVYATGESSLASATAAEKLAKAGFSQVYDFRGGVAAWRDAGYPVQGGGQTAARARPPEDRSYFVDTGESEFEWTGRSLGGRHTGSLGIAAGELKMRGGVPVGGGIALDMNSILDADIPEADMRELLHRHLASDDFFDVAQFPEARFEIDGSEAIPGALPGSPNLRVKGRLELKGVEEPVEFTAVTGVGPDGELRARANFDIDRTRWGVIYGSGRFYENLGMHLVNDLISIDLKIVAR